MKKCPFCAEEIQDAAIVCKHCNRNLPETVAKEKGTPKQSSGGAGMAVLVTLVLLFLMLLVTPIPVVLVSAIWAAYDSSKIELSRYRTGITYSPVVLFLAILFLWIVGFSLVLGCTKQDQGRHLETRGGVGAAEDESGCLGRVRGSFSLHGPCTHRVTGGGIVKLSW